MRTILAFGVLIVAILLGGCAEKSVTNPGLHPQSMETTLVQKINYLLYLPKDYAKTEKQWPLILFLHGSGKENDGWNMIKESILTKHLADGTDLPFIIIQPQCPKGLRWPDQTYVLLTLLDDIIERYRVEASRVYLTGLSMGGHGTWQLAIEHPDRFAAIAPVCGWGDAFLARRNLKKMPVWVFHGAKDKAVPLGKSEEMVEALRGVGNESIKFTVYPDAGHDSWTPTYTNPQLYNWFLKHSIK